MKRTEDSGRNTGETPEERPVCFGDMSKVCPRDEEGIMHPRVECLPCGFLRACLRHGLREQGVLPGSVLDTPAVSKVSRFLKRWSDRKLGDEEPR